MKWNMEGLENGQSGSGLVSSFPDPRMKAGVSLLFGQEIRWFDQCRLSMPKEKLFVNKKNHPGEFSGIMAFSAPQANISHP